MLLSSEICPSVFHSLRSRRKFGRDAARRLISSILTYIYSSDLRQDGGQALFGSGFPSHAGRPAEGERVPVSFAQPVCQELYSDWTVEGLAKLLRESL